ncbi:DUF2214 domain-containing protein [Stutzerimonas tarimensis]|uniref:DUF2214 domain-containing protein n=1 Tax=Stutzerimonas tarimensis TaxID=1507735 RepID=A0ABV7T6Y9_9GAMM
MSPDIWTLLSELPPAAFLRGSSLVYLLVNAAHIASLGLLIGTIVSLDLRVLGLCRGVPLQAIGPFLSRMAGWGLGLAILTGLWLFSVNAPTYVDNLAFRWKLVLIGLGLVNVVMTHARRDWRSPSDAEVTPALRVHAGLSLAIWLGVVLAGRWIGFM